MMNMENFITGIQHIGIPTKKYERTVSFYESLGFAFINCEINNGGRIAFLKLQNCVLEIYEEKEVHDFAGAIDHFALDVTNIDAVFNMAKSRGLNISDSEIRELPFWENGIRYFLVKGPNNEMIEFCQINQSGIHDA